MQDMEKKSECEMVCLNNNCQFELTDFVISWIFVVFNKKKKHLQIKNSIF